MDFVEIGESNVKAQNTEKYFLETFLKIDGKLEPEEGIESKRGCPEFWKMNTANK